MWIRNIQEPVGYLELNGQSISRNTYQRLYEIFGTTYGAEDDEHFNLPNVYNEISQPVGSILLHFGNTPPLNHLACDGTLYIIKDYQKLANFFLEEYGMINKFGGDGKTTFAVPDLRGEFLRDTGTNGHANQGSGSDVVKHQDATIIPWLQSFSGGTGFYIGYNSNTDGEYPTTQYADWSKNATKGKQTVFTASVSTTSDPRSINVTTRPTNTSVLMCIRYKNDPLFTTNENFKFLIKT